MNPKKDGHNRLKEEKNSAKQKLTDAEIDTQFKKINRTSKSSQINFPEFPVGH